MKTMVGREGVLASVSWDTGGVLEQPGRKMQRIRNARKTRIVLMLFNVAPNGLLAA